MDFTGYDYSVKLNHENRIQTVRWDFAQMRANSLAVCKAHNLTAKDVLTIAVKLSVDSTNLDRFTPIQLANGNKFTNLEAKKMFSGNANNPNTLTVNRFCAVFSPEISKYLQKHPSETWGQTSLENVDPKFCFPHAYYIPNLTSSERRQVFAFLNHMDLVMSEAISQWRSVSQKAAFYWRQKYNDTVTIKGDVFNVNFND